MPEGQDQTEAPVADMLAPAPPSRPDFDRVKAVPVRHYGRWIANVLIVVLAAMFIHTLFSKVSVLGQKPTWRFSWDVVGQYLFDPTILRGVVVTIELTAVSMILGIIIGTIVAIMRLSSSPQLRGAAWLYAWFWRGWPVLVQLLFFTFLAALYPTLSIGIPFGPHIHLWHLNLAWDTNSLVGNLFWVCAVTFGINEGAYFSEIVRAGIISVDAGQHEAAQAVGMTRGQTLRKVVLPQALRFIVPPAGNETISMLKTTSLAYTVSLVELTKAAINIYSRTYQTIPLLIVVCLWYLAMTTVLMIVQFFIERHFSRGVAGSTPRNPGRLGKWIENTLLTSRKRRVDDMTANAGLAP